MINGLIISHLSAECRGDKVYVPLNSKEMQLALDHGPLQNKSWELMCRSVRYRGGPDIIGNYELHYIRIKGIDRPLH